MGRVGCTVALEFLVVTSGKGVNVADTQERIPSASPARTVKDDRRTAYGWGRLMVVLYAVLALVMEWLAVVVYAVIAVAVAHNGRRMRILGGVALVIATIQCLVGFAFNEATYGAAWAGGGAALSYVPLVSCLLGAVWMWASNPRRIVQNAERITDIKRELAEKTAS